MIKHATPDHAVHELITRRWSPYGFARQPVPAEDLRALFEAARWAPSSYNEQPWRYIVATPDDAEAHARLLACLVEGNQAWAQAAPVLALGIAARRFTRNDKPNAAAIHDLGLAAGNLCLEATARGLLVHQMIGIQPEQARASYAIPEGFDAVTGFAIGYAADPESLPEQLRERDQRPRERKPLSEFVFGGRWGSPSRLVES